MYTYVYVYVDVYVYFYVYVYMSILSYVYGSDIFWAVSDLPLNETAFQKDLSILTPKLATASPSGHCHGCYVQSWWCPDVCDGILPGIETMAFTLQNDDYLNQMVPSFYHISWYFMIFPWFFGEICIDMVKTWSICLDISPCFFHDSLVKSCHSAVLFPAVPFRRATRRWSSPRCYAGLQRCALPRCGCEQMMRSGDDQGSEVGK
jgi:hypothetical protein